MEKVFLDTGYVTLNKKGEELCGDKVEIRHTDFGLTMVLADGLGSGVKANILATLTSSMLCNMISNKLDITDAVTTVIKTLPICKVRGVAYATFSIISVDNNGEGVLVEYDNPQAIFMRGGELIDLPRKEMSVEGKMIYTTELKLKSGDVLIINSDGVIHAGIGQLLNFGWERDDVKKYLGTHAKPNQSARCLSSIVARACYELYMGECGDDTTVACLKAMDEYPINIMVGPPASAERDEEVVRKFMAENGAHVVCGGTTSQIVSKVLGKSVSTDLQTITEELPPIGYMDGIDLVTEGVLTVRKLIERSNKYLNVKDSEIKEFGLNDGADRLGDMLFEQSTAVTFYIGRGVNPAHSELDIANSMKLHLVEELADRLKRLGKKVKLLYY